MRFGKLMAKLNSNLILGIFFYLIITPFAMIKRIFILLRKENKRKINTYFNRANKKVKYNFKDQV